MSPGARSASTGALLALGLADLVFLNTWVFPRTSLAQRLHALSGPAVAVDRATAAEPTPLEAPRPLAAAPPPERAPAPAESPPAPVESPPAPAPTPTLVPEPEPARPTELTRIERVGEPVRILFGHNQHGLSEESLQALAGLRRHRTGGARILIEGHADRTGVEVYNGWLSQQRADAVAGALAALGIDRQRMVVRGFGSSRPALPGVEARALRRNRRVEISVIAEVPREP